MYKLKVFKSVMEEYTFELDKEDLLKQKELNEDSFNDYLESKYYYNIAYEDRKPDDWTSEINFLEVEND